MTSEAVVHVIDDDEAVRHSLAFLLRSAKVEAKVYESATLFLEALPNIKSGCVITDVRMPDITGIDLLRRLREQKVALPVVVITGPGDVSLAVEAMKIGAADFVEKPFDDDVLLVAVRTALNQQEHAIQRATARSEVSERLATRSARERQVLEGLVAGHANKMIAFDLGISPQAVEIYRANV